MFFTPHRATPNRADLHHTLQPNKFYIFIRFKKLFETKTLVLVSKVDFNPKPRFGAEKLLNLKMVRFMVIGFFGEISEKLFETKTLVLVFKVDFNPKPWFGVEKLKSFYWLDGFYKNNQAINERTNERTNEQTNEQTNKRTNEQTNKRTKCRVVIIL